MAQEVAPPQLLDETFSTTTTTLGSLLSNHLILCQTLPYLPPSAILNLAATSRDFRGLIYETPLAFRHLDLTRVKTAQFDIDPIDSGGELWHNTQLDEHLTEDEFYSGPLRGIFSNLSRSNLLSSVQTLVLDGLSVTAELVHDILTDPSFNVRILSLRDVKNLNERKLQGALQTACRVSRPDGTPRLKGVYIFTQRDAAPQPAAAPATAAAASGASSAATTTPTSSSSASSGDSIGAEWNARSQRKLVEGGGGACDDAWYGRRGKMVTRKIGPEWAHTLLACRGVISFDAVLCAGPRHLNSPALGRAPVSWGAGASQWAVATHSVGGCSGCGSAPEGRTVWGRTRGGGLDGDYDYPLLAPAPTHSSRVKVACCPSGASLDQREAYGSWRAAAEASAAETGDDDGPPSFIARCFECLKDRYCWSCHKWWCESCYAGAGNADNKVRIDGLCGDC